MPASEREGECRVSERKTVIGTIATPWGEASELRNRRLYPGAGTPAEEVARNQRERLFGAVVALVSEWGYESTTVADILALSGVSRSAFYEHFDGKSQCLLAGASELIEPRLAALDPNALDGGAQAREIFEGFFASIAAQPAAARACFVELHATGEAGEALADRGAEALVARVEELGLGQFGEQGMGPGLMRTLIGGLRKVIHTRLARGEEGELERLAPELWRWLASVEPPPGPLVVPRRQRSAPVPFEGYTPAERIARAVAAVIAEKDYGATSTDDIAARAAISLTTFYAHFTDKHDALLGALEMSGAQVMALAVPAARRAHGWEQGVRALYESICAYFAAEPAMAQLATVGVYGAGRQALARRDRVIDSLAAMLRPGFEENPDAPAISAEVIGATVYALMREQVRKGGAESLNMIVPLATYITLVPFVGAQRALAVANGERTGKR